jgi:hypothetical protein
MRNKQRSCKNIRSSLCLCGSKLKLFNLKSLKWREKMRSTIKHFLWFFTIIVLINFLLTGGLRPAYATNNRQVVKQRKIAAVKAGSTLPAARKRTKLEETEERAAAAEARASEAEAAAAKAMSDAKVAQDMATQAMEQLRKVNDEVSRLQELMARKEQPSAESTVALNKTDDKAAPDANQAALASKTADKQDQPTPKQLEGVATSVSKLPIKFYGNIILGVNYLDRGSNNNEQPLFAVKNLPPLDQNHQNFNMSLRQTRFGLRYDGKIFNDANLSGVLEIDFFNGKPAVPNGVAAEIVRLRLAYGRIDWTKDSLEVGQDTTVFSPLNPTTIASFAVAGFSASGNLFNRFSQIRYEHREKVGEKSKLIFDISALDPNAGDNIGNTAARVIGLGERGSIPAFDSRIGFSTLTYGKETSAGVSAHYSRLLGVPGNPVGTLVRSPIDSYGVNGDLNVWLTPYLRLTGEVFHGRALGVFAGGILQSSVVINGRAQGINSTGGWAELHGEYKKFSTNVGFGIEDNRNEDLLTGLRDRNQTFLINGRYQFTPSFGFAIEYRQIQTDFFRQSFANQKLNFGNLALLYSF